MMQLVLANALIKLQKVSMKMGHFQLHPLLVKDNLQLTSSAVLSSLSLPCWQLARPLRLA